VSFFFFINDVNDSFWQFTGSQESVVNMDLDAPIISGLRPGHRRGTASPVVVPAGHHSSHQRSPSVTPDIQLPSDEPSTRTGRTDTVKGRNIPLSNFFINVVCFCQPVGTNAS
jgi:hypothetical protein